MAEEREWREVLTMVEAAQVVKRAELEAAQKSFEAAELLRDELASRLAEMGRMRDALESLLAPFEPWRGE